VEWRTKGRMGNGKGGGGSEEDECGTGMWNAEWGMGFAFGVPVPFRVGTVFG